MSSGLSFGGLQSQFSGSMALYDLGGQAMQLVEERGNEDGEADKAVKKIFRDVSEKSVVHLWDALKKRNDDDLAKSLHQIAILSGILDDTEDEIPALQKDLFAEAKEDKDVDETTRFSAVASFAMLRGDIDTCLAICKLRAPVDPAWAQAKQLYDKELFNWKELVVIYSNA